MSVAVAALSKPSPPAAAPAGLASDALVAGLRAIGENTRLRIVALLDRGELTVTELTQILGQSQPRVSRHLKVLVEAGLAERHREGAWIFYRSALRRAPDRFAWALAAVATLEAGDDPLAARDRARFEEARTARAEAAAAYFRAQAPEWDRVRGLHLPEAAIEARMRAMVGDRPVDLFVDLGVGTGRMLLAFADLYARGVGYDVSREMLAVARANLERAGLRNAEARLGDIFALPAEAGGADLVCVHQVLHYLAEPGAAVREAARLLKPGGRLAISDFAPHAHEFLRERHAHRRLGFSDAEVEAWCDEAGLDLVATDTLAPQDDRPEGLTVRIWLAAAPEETRRP